MAKALLFDIDYTLLYTSGAGGMAMTAAFQEMFGVADGFRGVEFSGRTDTAIFRDGLNNHGIGGEFSPLLAQFMQVYAGQLEVSLAENQGGLLPGVKLLLDSLNSRNDVVLSLGTGNFRRSGEMKLRHYGILHYFPDGGFADDGEDREEIVKVAAKRAKAAGGQLPVVIGDTPYDVAAAKANGFAAVGVATGDYSEKELSQSGADTVLPDMADWRATSDILLALGR